MPNYFDEAGMFDINAFDSRDYARDPDEQALRTDVFIAKFGRARSHKTGSTYWCADVMKARDLRSSLSYSDFKKAYNAVSFANAHGLFLDTMLTVHLEKLAIAGTGSRAPADLRAVQQRFLRHLNQWFRDRCLPNLHVGVTENGFVHGLHLHLLLFVPGHPVWQELKGRADPWIRGELRQWLRNYAPRNYGCETSNFFDLTRSNREDAQKQWHLFHYMMKGIGRTQVVVQGRHHVSGRDLTLGSLIAYRPSPLGPIPDELNVCWTSRDIGQGAQDRGHFSYGLHVIGKEVPNLVTIFDRPRTMYSTPCYQSELDAGIYDVRRLYGEKFAQWVMQKSFRPLGEQV